MKKQKLEKQEDDLVKATVAAALAKKKEQEQQQDDMAKATVSALLQQKNKLAVEKDEEDADEKLASALK